MSPPRNRWQCAAPARPTLVVAAGAGTGTLRRLSLVNFARVRGWPSPTTPFRFSQARKSRVEKTLSSGKKA